MELLEDSSGVVDSLPVGVGVAVFVEGEGDGAFDENLDVVFGVDEDGAFVGSWVGVSWCAAECVGAGSVWVVEVLLVDGVDVAHSGLDARDEGLVGEVASAVVEDDLRGVGVGDGAAGERGHGDGDRGDVWSSHLFVLRCR